MAASKVSAIQAAVKKAVIKFEGDIDGIREKISTLKLERDDLENGFLPKAEVIQRTHQFIDHEASKFEPEYLLNPMIRAGGNPHRSELFDISVRQLEFGYTGTVAPMLCFMLGDEIKKRLHDFVMSMEFQPGPPLKDRPRMIRTLDQQIRKLETEEESLICQAEESGLNFDRREDADPKIILEIVE